MQRTILPFIIFCICLFSGTGLNAQKAKFKTQVATIQKTRLPQNFIEPENRTYDLFAKGSYATDIDPHQKIIFGWTRNEESPNLKGVLSIYGFSMGGAKKSSQKKEKKNKEGKVIDRWTEYSYSGTANGRGTLYIYGESNPFVFEKKKKSGEKSKYELKKEAEAAAKKKDLEDNPFLTSDDVAEAEESDISVDEGLSDEAMALVKTIKVDQTKTVTTTGTHRSSTSAYKEYTGQRRPELYDFKASYPSGAYKSTISQLNYLYGYAPVNYKFYMRRMKSEKHAEYKKWNDACQATEMLFKAVRYNEPIEATQSKFDAIINYFSVLLDKTSDTDKKTKKLKKAAFQNLVDILYYLDRNEEAIIVCEKNLDSKFIDKTAKRKLERSQRQMALLAFHGMSTAHVESTGEIEMDDIESEEEADDEDSETNK